MTDDPHGDAERAVEFVDARTKAGAPTLEEALGELAHMAQELQRVAESGDGAVPDRAPNIEAGLRFMHLALAHTRDQLSSLQVAHESLVAALVANQTVQPDEVAQHEEAAVSRERQRRRKQPDVRLTVYRDKYELDEAVTIDCIDRLPLCKARCCTLDFELAEQDLDEGVVRWDYGRPYVIEKDATGCCVHNREHKCSIYGARPASCRTYDCRSDRRIWLDFDNRIPAPAKPA